MREACERPRKRPWPLTVIRVSKSDKGIEDGKDDIRLDHLIIVQLSQVFDTTDTTLIHLRDVDLQ